MQDNASIHRTKEILDFFDMHDIPKLLWPARSPVLNPIENLWGIITRKLDALVDIRGEATTEEQLWQRVQECANTIDRKVFKNLYKSLGKRIKSVIERKGFYTKY